MTSAICVLGMAAALCHTAQFQGAEHPTLEHGIFTSLCLDDFA